MLERFRKRAVYLLRKMNPPQIIVLMFLAVILTGAAILTLPASSAAGTPTDFLTCLFTATSATCVTGLSVVETGLHWSVFGQWMILLMIQIGGLGFMSIACVFYIVLRRRIGLKKRMILAQALSLDSMNGVVRMVRNVVLGTLAVELCGAALLTACFLRRFPFWKALRFGIFHAVSAYCNAGFDILADVDAGGSLSFYAADPAVNFIIMALIIIGGLGFLVWGELRRTRRFSRLSVYTRLVLIISAVLTFGGAALLADGVLTPAVTVTTAVEGLRSIPAMDRFLGSGQTRVVLITLVIISTLFAVQWAGTSKIGKAFGPVMLVWFSFLGVMGVLHIFDHPGVLRAFNPVYAVRILVSPYNKAGFMILGSVFLAATGAEALYSDMGHVGRGNIYASWPFVKACLILNYLGQGAWILPHTASGTLAAIPDMNPFFQMLPEALRAPAVALGALAAIIASQALITGSYTLVSEAIRLDLMPHLEVRYPSDTKGQIYIGAVNTVLYLGCAAVVLYFRTSARMESAYGLAITVTMLMTTLLLAVYLWNIRRKHALAVGIALVFGAIETVFFVSSLSKFAHGGYVAVLMALVLFLIMVVWRRGTQLEQEYATRLPIRDYLPNLDTLHEDTSLPLLADNLVFLDKAGDMDTIDRDILYSILDKDPKRAAAYWFISMNVTDEPDTRRYSVETYGTDYIFRVRLDLGFKCHQRVNVYLRQIVRDLIESGELPPQERKYSIYGKSDVGSFKFIFLHKAVPSKSELSFTDELVLNTKYAIRRVAGSKVRWYGLDTSSLVVETVPLIVGGKAPRSSRLERVL